MKLSDLASRRNLKLAWRRVTTGGNYQYKRFFRPSYQGYEVALDAHLKNLRSRLLARAWRPSSPERIYVPKKSGLQRPISLLRIEDQIVLQAIANRLSVKLQRRRQPFLLASVFSNILDSPTSVFFLRNWRKTYKTFHDRMETHYRDGRRWVLDFDLAAFYDTVSHELLLRTAFPRAHDSEDVRWIGECLSVWSNSDSNATLGHGVPQGPIASDYLAELFLLPVDEIMSPGGGYLRYVDDIRLVGRTEDEVRRLGVKLEVACRERGLIPQVDKLALRRAKSLREAVGALPSINDPHRDEPFPSLDPSRAEALAKPAVGGRPLRVHDKTRLRYVLFRSTPSAKLSKMVSTLLPRHPEHSDAFAAYLARCRYSEARVGLYCSVLDSSPYEYVAAQMWLLLAGQAEALLRQQPILVAALTDQARSVVRAADSSCDLQWGAGEFLCRVESSGGAPRMARSVRFVSSELAQSLLAACLPDDGFVLRGVAAHWCEGSGPEPALALASRLLDRRLTLRAIGADGRRVNPVARQTLAALGLIGPLRPGVDVVGETIRKRFAVTSNIDWRPLLAGEYGYATALLSKADALFHSARSEWLITQNAFNQVVFNALQRHLQATGAPGAVPLTKANGDLIDFGAITDPTKPFSVAHPRIGTVLFRVNHRRNRLPEAHPYQRSGGQRNRYLGKQERNRFVRELRDAYEAVLALAPRR